MDNTIRGCLRHMADQGLLSETVGQALNKFVLPDLILVAQLSPADRCRFAAVATASENDRGGSRTDYDAAVKHLGKIHQSRNYSRGIRQADQRMTQAFRIFMDANGFAYSHDAESAGQRCLPRRKQPLCPRHGQREQGTSSHAILIKTYITKLHNLCHVQPYFGDGGLSLGGIPEQLQGGWRIRQ